MCASHMYKIITVIVQIKILGSSSGSDDFVVDMWFQVRIPATQSLYFLTKLILSLSIL
jgi:hypothetical protein